jgi:hypothetical protein
MTATPLDRFSRRTDIRLTTLRRTLMVVAGRMGPVAIGRLRIAMRAAAGPCKAAAFRDN